MQPIAMSRRFAPSPRLLPSQEARAWGSGRHVPCATPQPRPAPSAGAAARSSSNPWPGLPQAISPADLFSHSDGWSVAYNFEDPFDLYLDGDYHGMLGMDLVAGALPPALSGHGSALQNAAAEHNDASFAPDSLLRARADMEVATDIDAPPAPALQDNHDRHGNYDHAVTTHHSDEHAQPGQPAAQALGEAPALDAPRALHEPMHNGFADPFSVPDAMLQESVPFPPPEQRLSAFARLRFSDGSYYMHTYQIILGRNVELAHRDMRRMAKYEKFMREGDVKRAQAVLRGKKRKETHQGPRSVISETGGIVSAPYSAMPQEYQQRRQSVASHSISSSSHQHAESSQEEHTAPRDVIMQAFDEVPEQLDRYVPENPNDCPLVPIHPQRILEPTGVKGPKGISREHAKIFYNFETGAFQLEILSSNGVYHEDTLYRLGDIVELNHGDTIGIGMVDMTFFLPDIALTEEQRAQQESSGSRPMSFSFENGRGELESEDQMENDSASEEASVDPRHVFHMPISEMDSEDDVIGEEDEEDEDEDEDETSSPEPRHRKQTVKPKLKIKLNNKAASRNQMPPPRKVFKNGHKRKPVREPSPEEPIAKRAKTKPKEVDKGKTPAKPVPAKGPTKELPQAKAEKKSEPAKVPKPESPTLARRPTAEGRESGDEGEQEGTITAEMVKRHNLPDSLIGMVMEKRKGPGRPPKDGVMSKRQRAQLVKQGKEIEKAKAAGINPADIPMPITKPKVARPRKDSNVNAAEGEDEDIRESTEKGDGTANSSDKKQTKTSKPARTPSPEMRIEDYTEEQLQRPSANYVVLIHEAISSSKTGQMNLQQIYNYIEKKYPWYKFKTTTSGWQSSVRHNLGQHDAFVKGDKEGKGFNWRINPEVSIEKERRKRQVSPQANHAQRQGYYPPPNGYPPYGHPGPYYPGMPQGPPNGAPRPPQPPVEPVQPRLPPSLARSAAAAATPAPQGPPNPSPYSSPWAGGHTAGSPVNQNPPRSFPPPSSHTPPASSAPAPSGQYGVLFPTSAPQAGYPAYPTAGAYGGQNATAGASPYSNGQPRPYPLYASAGSPPHGSQLGQPPMQPPAQQTFASDQPQHPPPSNESRIFHPSGRYPLSTNPELIHQLEAFRRVYLDKTTLSKPEEENKVDNVIRALVNPDYLIKLNDSEQQLMDIVSNIATIKSLGVVQAKKEPVVKQELSSDDIISVVGERACANRNPEVAKPSAASTAAAIAASDAAVAASVLPNNASSPSTRVKPAPSHLTAAIPPIMASINSSQPLTVATTSKELQPQRFTPNMGGPPASSVSTITAAVPSPIQVQASRPSVEPLTPVPGSPAIPNAPGLKQSLPKTSEQADTGAGAKEEVTNQQQPSAAE